MNLTVYSFTEEYENVYEETTTDLFGSSTPLSIVIEEATYCGPAWKIFWKPFRRNYVEAKVILCTIGLLTNILNLIIFTRPKMRTPTNMLLSFLAIADLLCVTRELQYIVVQKLRLFDWNTYPNAVNELLNEISLTLFHTWSVYLTLGIACWRLIGVLQPLKSRRWFTWKGAGIACATAIVVGILLMIPLYHAAYIQKKEVENTTTLQYSWTLRNSLAWDIYIWVNAIFLKMLPSQILAVAIISLVISLLKVQKNRKALMGAGSIVVREKNLPRLSTSSTDSKDRRDFIRTTRTLLVVLVIFLFTEMPAGLAIFFNGVFGYKFFLECRQPALAFFNLTDYLSSATSFFVYVFMSTNFRAYVTQFFHLSVWKRFCCSKK